MYLLIKNNYNISVIDSYGNYIFIYMFNNCSNITVNSVSEALSKVEFLFQCSHIFF